MKKETKVDWDKVHFSTKIFSIISMIAMLFVFISILIGIWLPPYPTLKAVATGVVIFIIGAGIVRIDILDENGDIKERFIKNS